MGDYNLAGLIFAREVSRPLIGLVKAIDRQIGESSSRRKDCKPGVFVVFCSDDPGLPQQLQQVVAREGLKHVVLSVSQNKSQGPPRYRVARDAELTVVVYDRVLRRGRVTANFVLDSEDLTADRTGDILAALRKIMP